MTTCITHTEPVHQRGSSGPLAGWRPVCVCGWKGQTTKRRPDADVDALEHIVGHPVKPAKSHPGRYGV